MKLDRKIVLVRPGPVTRAPDGSPVEGAPTRIVRSAGRQAGSASAPTTADTSLFRASVTYTLRFSGLDSLDTSWWLEDDGVEYRIESVKESPIGRRQYMVIEAVARE